MLKGLQKLKRQTVRQFVVLDHGDRDLNLIGGPFIDTLLKRGANQIIKRARRRLNTWRL